MPACVEDSQHRSDGIDDGAFGRAKAAAVTLREILPVLQARWLDQRKNGTRVIPFRLPPFLFAGGMVTMLSPNRAM